jgi:hypothetical protein
MKYTAFSCSFFERRQVGKGMENIETKQTKWEDLGIG